MIRAPHWLIIVIILVAAIILSDEIAYLMWKRYNPGAKYSHLWEGPPVSPVDPRRPPRVIVED